MERRPLLARTANWNMPLPFCIRALARRCMSFKIPGRTKSGAFSTLARASSSQGIAPLEDVWGAGEGIDRLFVQAEACVVE